MKNFFATAASVIVLGLAVPALADSNTSATYQNGTGGQSINVTQVGSAATNNSAVYQGYYNATSHDNRARVEQLGSDATDNTSNVVQDGSFDKAHVHQQGSGVIISSSIGQSGSGNRARVNQDGSAGLNNSSSIGQVGDNNRADVMQTGIGNSNKSVISQSGSSHRATVKQGDTYANNKSYVTQFNDSNTATVNQGDVLGDGSNTNN